MALSLAPRPDLPPELVARVRPVTLGVDRTLPVLEALTPLVPPGGLPRGATVSVGAGVGASGATSLALALAAGPSAAGAWVAGVGLPALGLVAAAACGIDLDRFPQIDRIPAGRWAEVVGALIDGFDVVLVGPGRIGAADSRRLVSRARERGAVLIQLGARWIDAPDVSLQVVGGTWDGLGHGHGHLQGRRVEVAGSGRRGAARSRREWLWLPHPDGGVRRAEAPRPLATVRSL